MIKKLLILFSLILFASCAQPMGGAEEIADIQPNPQRPSDESVEGGLWFYSDKSEESWIEGFRKWKRGTL